jgi:Mg2+/Co2+ transporter CorB
MSLAHLYTHHPVATALGHMAMVASVDSRDLIGIITLEDVFEELIQVLPLGGLG